MSKHTPGPWTIRETATHITVIGANNESLFHDDKRIPCVIQDARLIAAAPDLLDALRAMLDNCHDTERDDAIVASVAAARAAIAKATGEA